MKQEQEQEQSSIVMLMCTPMVMCTAMVAQAGEGGGTQGSVSTVIVVRSPVNCGV